jgi:hypothetical protein
MGLILIWTWGNRRRATSTDTQAKLKHSHDRIHPSTAAAAGDWLEKVAGREREELKEI